jgi:hypothetical protein
MRYFLCLLLLACSLNVLAGPKDRSIKGTVLDTDLEVLAGAKIEVVGTDIVVYSDLEGKFTIEQLKPGSYQLLISMVSYQVLEVEEITLNSPSSSSEMKFSLHSR